MRSGTTGSAWLLASGLALCVALAGCSAEFSVGGDSNAPGDELADGIRDDYVDRTGIELTRLTCEGAEAKVGTVFRCSGRNARGIQLEIAGRVTDTTGDGFDYRWNVVEGVAPGVLYERALRGALEDDGVAVVEVLCPVEVRLKAGAKLRCKATAADGSSRGVTLRLTDLDGGFDYQVDGEKPTAA